MDQNEMNKQVAEYSLNRMKTDLAALTQRNYELEFYCLSLNKTVESLQKENEELKAQIPKTEEQS